MGKPHPGKDVFISNCCAPTFATVPLPLLLKCLLCAKTQSFMQLETLDLRHNRLVGSLPETWSNLASVRPIMDLTS